MKLRNRQQLLLAIAIAAIALLAVNHLVFGPLERSWKARSARLGEVRKSVTQGRLLLDRASSIRTRWEGMRTNALPSEPSVAENRLLKAFDRWTQESRVGVSAIKPQSQWKSAAPDHATLECRVDAFGNLSALTRFLYNVERDPLGVKVEAVELTARDDGGEQLTLGLQVSGLALLSGDKP